MKDYNNPCWRPSWIYLSDQCTLKSPSQEIIPCWWQNTLKGLTDPCPSHLTLRPVNHEGNIRVKHKPPNHKFKKKERKKSELSVNITHHIMSQKRIGKKMKWSRPKKQKSERRMFWQRPPLLKDHPGMRDCLLMKHHPYHWWETTLTGNHLS